MPYFFFFSAFSDFLLVKNAFMQYIIYLISVLNPEISTMPDEDTFQVACPRCGDTFNVPILLLEKKAQ